MGVRAGMSGADGAAAGERGGGDPRRSGFLPAFRLMRHGWGGTRLKADAGSIHVHVERGRPERVVRDVRRRLRGGRARLPDARRGQAASAAFASVRRGERGPCARSDGTGMPQAGTVSAARGPRACASLRCGGLAVRSRMPFGDGLSGTGIPARDRARVARRQPCGRRLRARHPERVVPEAPGELSAKAILRTGTRPGPPAIGAMPSIHPTIHLDITKKLQTAAPEALLATGGLPTTSATSPAGTVV